MLTAPEQVAHLRHLPCPTDIRIPRPMPDSQRVEIGSTIRKLREDFGLSRYEVAAETPCTVRYLRRVETGRAEPSKSTVVLLTRAMVHLVQQRSSRSIS